VEFIFRFKMYWGNVVYNYPISTPSNVHVQSYRSGCGYHDFDQNYPPQLEGFVDPQNYGNELREITLRFNNALRASNYLSFLPILGFILFIVFILVSTFIGFAWIIVIFFFVFFFSICGAGVISRNLRLQVPLKMASYLNELSARYPGTTWRINASHYYRYTAWWLEICLDLSRRQGGGGYVSTMPGAMPNVGYGMPMGGMPMGGMPNTMGMGGVPMGGMPMGGMPMGGMPMGGMPNTMGVTVNAPNSGLVPPSYTAAMGGSAFCAKCGTLRAQEDTFCRSCGNRF